MTTVDVAPLAVTELFAAQTRRKLLVVFFNNPDEWFRKADLTEEIDASGESIRMNLGELLKFGIITVRDDTARIKHYQLADSDPVALIEETVDMELLCELFAFTARQELVSFFIDQTEPDEWFTRYKLNDELGINYETLKKHLPVLVELGLLETQDGSRSTEYQLRDGPVAVILYELNEALAETYDRER